MVVVGSIICIGVNVIITNNICDCCYFLCTILKPVFRTMKSKANKYEFFLIFNTFFELNARARKRKSQQQLWALLSILVLHRQRELPLTIDHIKHVQLS